VLVLLLNLQHRTLLWWQAPNKILVSSSRTTLRQKTHSIYCSREIFLLGSVPRHLAPLLRNAFAVALWIGPQRTRNRSIESRLDLVMAEAFAFEVVVQRNPIPSFND
jgi:hypothetical protein